MMLGLLVTFRQRCEPYSRTVLDDGTTANHEVYVAVTALVHTELPTFHDDNRIRNIGEMYRTVDPTADDQALFYVLDS